MKTTNGVVAKYVYGRGLIGEEVGNVFKIYHFDYRGSTIAITDANGNITDTFAYDTYGKLISRTGTSFVIFGYNGRDGVVTDKNGLIYMRTRYYSPEMRRFINADVIPGRLTAAITLNRYAYANGNPAMHTDPSGLLVGGLLLGGLLLGGLLIGLTSSSKQKESSTQSSSQSSSTNRQAKTEPAPASEQPSTPKITSVEQARNLYLSGQISLEDIPPQYSWEPSIRAQYVEEQEKQKEQANPPKSASELEEIAISIAEKTVEKALDETIDWGASRLDKAVGFGDLIVPDRTRPSVYIGAAKKTFSTAQKINDILGGAVNNYNAGNPWGETISDIGIEVVGLGWDASWGVIGASIGTFFFPGVGTVAGAIMVTGISMVADLVYNNIIAPCFDQHFEYN